MEVRLVQLLASFIGTSADYALARLEFALHHAGVPAPPVIDRLPDASETTLRTRFPRFESQLEAALAYAKQLDSPRSSLNGNDNTAGRLRRTLKELDQYARAIRWVLTVNER
ncbi:MAG TPA: hypothetical protein VIG51_08390 [Candidatus Baltobacteraceae bacterium]|jgi:hypothetical protein